MQPIILIIAISHVKNRLRRLHRTPLALSCVMQILTLLIIVFESVTRVQRNIFLLSLIDW
jgi:hypothetical protein